MNVLHIVPSAMAQLFHRATNTIARVTIIAIVLGLGVASVVAMAIDRSPYVTNQDVVRDQPVPFSHKHHVGELGIDCRYCHGGVEDSSFAGMPATKTCMTCHARIWTDAALLEPVRQSWLSGKPLKWTRVHNLPDFTYFRHDIHVNKGVACITCHGQVDEMPLMWQNATLQMQWCLDCHRNPEKFVRPREHVFDLNFAITDLIKREYSTSGHQVDDQLTLGEALVELYHIPKGGRESRLTNCYTCHR